MIPDPVLGTSGKILLFDDFATSITLTRSQYHCLNASIKNLKINLPPLSNTTSLFTHDIVFLYENVISTEAIKMFSQSFSPSEQKVCAVKTPIITRRHAEPRPGAAVRAVQGN